MKWWAGWITVWNQDCQEKYQQPHICRWYHTNVRKWRGTKKPLDEGGRGEWKIWLKIQHSKNKDHGIRTHHFMEKMGKNGNSGRFYFLGVQNHYRWWLWPWNLRCLLHGRKAMTNLDGIFGVEPKKAEHKGIDAFKLWCWRRLLRFTFDSNEIKPVNPKGN